MREVRANLRSTTGYVAGQETESSLEMDFCALARSDLAVERFVSQPVKIVYVDGADRERYCTPGVLLIPHRSQNGVFLKRPMLCEIKFLRISLPTKGLSPRNSKLHALAALSETRTFKFFREGNSRTIS